MRRGLGQGELWIFASLYVVALLWHLWSRSRKKPGKQKDHREGT